MSHDHGHPHSHDDGHGHPHRHDHPHADQPLPAALDLTVPASELSPAQVGRRSFLQRAGLLGAAAVGAGALGTVGAGTAAAQTTTPDSRRGPTDARKLLWLAGDHHIHTNHSNDAQYLVSEQVARSAQYGLDWMVITDHGSVGHQKFGVEQTAPEIAQARVDNARTLVFQGFEWNIPAAEHGTIFVAPGEGAVPLLKEFEGTYDGAITGTSPSSAANEALARTGLTFLQDAVTKRRVSDALFLANHPARNGIDSPHEIRGWRDAAPTVAVGFEGAPGHQAAAIPGPGHERNGRGYYSNAQNANSFPGYGPETYVTYGGFDWMTATVGGLWDSLLAEGKPWWISANSDSHQIYNDTRTQGTGNVTTTGTRGVPIDTGVPIPQYGDFWPGYYSSTVVGATDFTYPAVMGAIRDGRMYVVHGGLVGALQVTLTPVNEPSATLGGTALYGNSRRLQLTIDVTLADRPNYHGDLPVLKKLDVIVGQVKGPVSDADSFTAPDTKVVQSFDVPATAPGGVVSLTYDFRRVDGPFYVRLRGSDGKRNQVGLRGAAIDPSGPRVDALGNADPWQDLWFYTNPIFAYPKK